MKIWSLLVPKGRTGDKVSQACDLKGEILLNLHLYNLYKKILLTRNCLFRGSRRCSGDGVLGIFFAT